MQKYDYDLNGCDSSNEMLDIARKKLPHIDFTNSALPSLLEIPENEYNIILCLFDTMNYLPNENTLTNSFQNIYKKLKTPGIFIFDVVTNFYCKEYFQYYQENEVIAKKTAYSRISEFDSRHSTQINYIRVYTENSVFEEIHQQNIFDLQLIKNIILAKTGFHFINMFEDFSFQKANRNSGRVHFVLKKH
jgi:SAM-dependent methyltransferase